MSILTPEHASDETINRLVEFGSVEGANPFDPVTQAGHLEWLRRKRTRRTERLQAKFADAIQALPDAEAEMRRAFKRWDKLSRLAARLEKALDKLHAEECAHGDNSAA